MCVVLLPELVILKLLLNDLFEDCGVIVLSIGAGEGRFASSSALDTDIQQFKTEILDLLQVRNKLLPWKPLVFSIGLLLPLLLPPEPVAWYPLVFEVGLLQLLFVIKLIDPDIVELLRWDLIGVISIVVSQVNWEISDFKLSFNDESLTPEIATGGRGRGGWGGREEVEKLGAVGLVEDLVLISEVELVSTLISLTTGWSFRFLLQEPWLNLPIGQSSSILSQSIIWNRWPLDTAADAVLSVFLVWLLGLG